MKILITVKTYPNPSASYNELVCTAGVREDGSLARLYPIPYRYLADEKQFKKYQWIKVDTKQSFSKDPRAESYQISNIDSLKIVSDVIPTNNSWSERKKYVLANGANTMCDLRSRERNKCSLGIVKPRKVERLIVSKAESDWNHRWQGLVDQINMYGPTGKPLEMMPYKFSYKFRCEEEGCPGHTMMITDWELFSLFRKIRDESGDDTIAIEKVKEKFLNQICGPNRDTHFFVGTVKQHGTWIVIGTFWPPLVKQMGFQF